MEEKLKQIKSNCKKVVLYGPESTGKTTLSIELAKHFKTNWVPEYAREYLQTIWDNEKRICEPKDILPIAIGQMKLENKLAIKSKSLLICDTNLFETMVYSKYYYGGNCDPLLEKYALKNDYDLYLLTDIDIPWEKDDLRDKPNERQESFEIFKNELIKKNLPFEVINGSRGERLKKAINSINKII
jgi:NadR type nicotinamide-nucleotide adenylyltransferase